MTSVKTAILLFIIPLLCSCTADKPFDTVREIHQQCMLERQTALTAIRLRNKGKTRQQLAGSLSALDRESGRLLVVMHEIVKEIYQYPALNEAIYPAYRLQLCQRQLGGKPYPINFAQIYSALLLCQQQQANSTSSATDNCVTRSFSTNSKQKR